MSTWPDRKAAAFVQRRDEVRIDRAIGRLLASAAQPQQRPKAIFRVVPDGQQFGFTQSLTGLADAGPVVERFGPFATERAAHALAKRTAARLSAEDPRFIVGVVGIEDEARPGLPASTRFKAEGFAVGQTVATPTCITCGKPTRYRHGRPQLYCPKSGQRNQCIEAAKARRNREDPSKKAAQAKRSRDRYARLMATPEGRARMREKWQQREAKRSSRKSTVKCEQELLGIVPRCEVCDKPTHYAQGKPVRFCSKQPGEKRSKCNMIYSARAYQKKIQVDPELKSKKRARDEAARKLRRSSRRLSAPLPTGSVFVTASPRGPGYELMARLYSAVPTNMPPSLRADIIGQTALLVLEGAEMKTAVAEATKSVRRCGSRLRYAKSIDDCFWLADDPQEMPEMV
jgi:hypothetical protein